MARVIFLAALSRSISKAMTDESFKIINESGYPLQIAVGNAVSATTREHGWTVRYIEHSWANQNGSRGFIDLILQDKHRSTFLIVECKRVRNSTWAFMHVDGKTGNRYHAKSWASYYSGGRMKSFNWRDVTLDPSSPEAGFCAIRGQSAGDRNTIIERVGGELISATEAFAAEERDFREESTDCLRLYFNVIVTTASLSLAAFSPDDISLADGTLARASFQPVPFIRFRKQMSEQAWAFSPTDFAQGTDPSAAKENTVFIVSTEGLSQFLRSFELHGESISQLTQLR